MARQDNTRTHPKLVPGLKKKKSNSSQIHLFKFQTHFIRAGRDGYLKKTHLILIPKRDKIKIKMKIQFL